MNDPTPRWSPMVTGPEDEFASFLDFGDLNFPTFDGIPQNEEEFQQNGTGAMDTTMEGTEVAFTPKNGHAHHQQVGQHHQEPALNGFHGSTESFPDLAMQSELFEQQQRQHLHMRNQRYYSNQNGVPPTPNSLEMHGGRGPYYQAPADRQQLHLYDQYRRFQKDQMVFTPLVSPAVTPLEAQFQYPDYAPVDAFSPLTSPALRAQNQAAAHNSIYRAVKGSDTSDTTSPIDPNLDFSGTTSSAIPAGLRKSKRKTSSSSIKNPARAVRQSPAMKPHSRKKHPSSTIIPPKEISGILEEARKSKQSTPKAVDGKMRLPYSQDSSGPDSVSPEPLSEILMPPPATPKSGSAGRSPYLNAKQQASHPAPVQDINGEPATPASLMKIRKQAGKFTGTQRSASNLKEQTALAEANMEQIMEEMVLPEAANASKKPALAPINTKSANTGESTPTMPASKATKDGPASAPVTANTSALPSPQLGTVASPTNMGGSKRGDIKLRSRDPKKRNSQSSIHVSPALRPKISPSIKPLLPEGTIVSPETSALLLASKSNYQNILEGTHFPGVSYPETLSTNLTSKRTSHKIAEQGRRNRINTALQEIASLLPPSTPHINGVNGQASANMMMNGTAAQQSNSKASTVELAIDYIKSLKKELAETKGRLQAMEQQVTGSSPALVDGTDGTSAVIVDKEMKDDTAAATTTK